MLINYSEMMVNYNVMHCKTLHYTVEHTATHYSSDNKTRSYNVVAYVVRLLPPEHIAAKSTAEDKYKCRIM